ncbi:Dop1 protein [Saccharomycopsis crataegensis]|uniref:Dop1 protein n=1 Tax=Saccharomycopsis crataegensis TaxID=43959 RepID=A0AAV5QTH0_9ASCO|nr:Dop1 protein [Saccharomycopsis crataegensis]
MISRLKLCSPVLSDEKKTSRDDTEKLIMSACLTVLRKDMSLNRRLWNWLLGTDDSISTPVLEVAGDVSHNGTISDTSSKNRMMTRIKYFTEYGQQSLVEGFLKLINSDFLDDRIKGYKVSLAFMDKWEIGLLITSKIFVPFLRSVQSSLFESNNLGKPGAPEEEESEEIKFKKEKYDELFKSASAFFDTIESSSIWSTCFELIHQVADIKTLNENLKLLMFIIKSFNVSEEDMVIDHLPLMLISLIILKLNNYNTAIDNAVLFEIIKDILEMIPGEVFYNGEGEFLSKEQALYLKELFDEKSDSETFNRNIEVYSQKIYSKIAKIYSKEEDISSLGNTILQDDDDDDDDDDDGDDDDDDDDDDDEDDKSLIQIEEKSDIDETKQTLEVLNDTEITENEMLNNNERSISVFILFTFIMCKALDIDQENGLFYSYSTLYSDMLDKIPVMNSSILVWKDNQLNTKVMNKAHKLINAVQKKNSIHSISNVDRNLILDFYSLGISDNIIDRHSDNNRSSIDDSYVSIAFGISSLFAKLMMSYTEPHQKMNLLKLTLELLYNILILPSNKYQIEATTFLLSLELASEPEYIESGIASIFSKLNSQNEFEKIIKVVKILWGQTSTIPSDIVVRKPIFIILDELKHRNSNYLMISDWITYILQEERRDRFFNIVISPILEFKFLFTKKLELIDDFDIFNYHLETIINIFQVDEANVTEALQNEILQIDSNLLAILQQNSESGNGISTYTGLIIHILLEFLSLKINYESETSGIGYEIFESESFNRASLSCITLLSLLLDANEANTDEIMTKLINMSYKNLKHGFEKQKLSINPSIEQLVSINFFNLISSYIDKCHHKDKRLSILDINLESPIRSERSLTKSKELKFNYIEYLVFSLGYVENPLVFKYWVNLLVKTLVNLSDCIFQVLIPITESICAKIKSFFKLIKFQLEDKKETNDQQSSFSNVDNVDQVIGLLMNALEELLSYSHMYLSASEAKPKGSSKNVAADPGFLTSVMSGVFSVESPDAINFEESNRYTVLLAFESTIESCFDIWLWGDSKTSLTKYTSSASATSLVKLGEVSSIMSNNVRGTLDSLKSLENTASKIKFKSRKLLEKLYQIEPLQLLHTLMKGDPSFSSSLFKMLHVLDNSRPQITIPHIFDSINIKLNPDAIKSDYKSSLTNKFVDKSIGIFLVEYLKSLDIEVIEDIYTVSMNFLKDVNAMSINYNSVIPYILQFASILTKKLSKLKFGEQKKIRKEVGDNYLRLLSYALSSRGVLGKSQALPIINDFGEISTENGKPLLNSHEENLSAEKINESVITTTTTSQDIVTRKDICLALIAIIPDLSNPIIQEGEKSVTVISSIILNAIQPLLKSRKVSELPNYVIELILVISESSSSMGNRIWRGLIYEIFTDPDFFNIDINDKYLKDSWARIISAWINDDKDKIIELIAKVQPFNGNSSTLFNWNEGETTSKVLKLKRITYLLLISTNDKYMGLLKDLVDKLVEVLQSSKNELHSQVFLSLRALVLRFSATHLNNYWITMYSELEKAFSDFIIEMMNFEEEMTKGTGETSRDLSESVDVQLLLSASKLLDLILTLGFEEFQLDEWIFIDDSMETVSRGIIGDGASGKTYRSAPLVIGLIDKISRLRAYKLPIASDGRKVKIVSDAMSENRYKIPMLYGYSYLEGLELLKPFFDSLSYYNFERVYGLKTPDLDKCVDDVYNDLFKSHR